MNGAKLDTHTGLSMTLNKNKLEISNVRYQSIIQTIC